MGTYVTLINFTDQGIRNIKESPARQAAAAKLAESMGAAMKAAYWTVGQYDMVVVFEGPEDALAACMYKIGSMGNVRTCCMRAFTPDEMQKIVAKIPG